MKEFTKHPLARDGVRSIHEWDEWQKFWDENPVAEIRHSLLHFGLDIPNGADFSQRIRFYLSIADTMNDCYQPFILKDEYGGNFWSTFGNSSHSSIRMGVAKKAFEVLWHKVFNAQDPHRSSHHPPLWLRNLSSPEVFKDILFFFRINEAGRLVNPYYSSPGLPDHIRKGVEEFLYQFCSFGWGDAVSSDWEEYAGDKAAKLFADNRQELVKILYALGKLDRLFTKRVPMDPECRKVLLKLVLSQSGNFPDTHENRKPKDLREAIFIGSKTAALILSKDIESEERERLLKIQKLRLDQEDARRRIKDLTR